VSDSSSQPISATLSRHPAVLELVSANQLAPNARHAPQTPSYALQPTVARSDGVVTGGKHTAPTRDTLPQRPQRPRVPEAIQHAHLDHQITRCPSSLPASPSIIRPISPSSLPLARFQVRDSLFWSLESISNFQQSSRSWITSSAAISPSSVRLPVLVRRARCRLQPTTNTSHGFSNFCSLDTPTWPVISCFLKASPPATSYPSFSSTAPRSQHIQHVFLLRVCRGRVRLRSCLPFQSFAGDGNPRRHHMEDVQHIPPAPSVVTRLPHADPPAPMPLEHSRTHWFRSHLGLGHIDGNRSKSDNHYCVPFRRLFPK